MFKLQLKFPVLAGLVIAGGLISACGVPSLSSSRLHDLTYPGSPDLPNQLIWQDADFWVLGQCPKQTVAAPANCPVQRRSTVNRLQAGVFSAIDRDILPLTQSLADEVVKLRATHPLVLGKQARIANIREQISNDSLSLNQINTQIDALRAKIQGIDTMIADYNKQIVAVDGSLQQNPADPQLNQLKANLSRELADQQTKRNRQNGYLTTLLSQAANFQQNISAQQSQIADIQSELSTLGDTLDVRSSVSEGLRAQIAALRAERDAWDGLVRSVRLTGISLRAETLEPAPLRLVCRLLALWPKIDGWREDFTSPLRSTLMSPWQVVNEASIAYASLSGLNGTSYPPYLNTTITLPSIDLNGIKRAHLSFRHRYDTESCCDYGLVEMKDPRGQWVSLSTTFRGSNWSWRDESISLDSMLMGLQTVELRLRFFSDSGVSGRGWDINYLQLNFD